MNELETAPSAPAAEIVDIPKTNRTGCLVGCLILLPILYALSWPVQSVVSYQLYLAGHKTIHDVMLRIEGPLYAPLQWGYDNSHTIRRFYNWYFSLFGRWMPQP